jgi:hypothetical protein
MKKAIKLSLATALLTASITASTGNVEEGILASDITKNANLRVYGLALKVGYPNSDLTDESYSGAGMQFENDSSNIVLEYGSDYKKGFGVFKYDITSHVYVKGGLGLLQRQMLIVGSDADVKQVSVGGALGYGDRNSYNIEAGYINSKLSNAADADGSSKTRYIELIKKHSFGEYMTFDFTGLYQKASVFSKNYSDHQAELGWFASDDVRAYVNHNSIDHDKDDYSLRAGIQYTFNTGNISPYIKASSNTNANTSFGIEYYEGIANKSLKMRDYFENFVGTSQIVAQTVAPEVFREKTTAKTTATTTPAVVDTEAPVITGGTTGGPIGSGSVTSVTKDFSGIVSDNITSFANLTVLFVSSIGSITGSKVGNTVTFVGTSGGGQSTCVFKFVDEAGNESVTYNQIITLQ